MVPLTASECFFLSLQVIKEELKSLGNFSQHQFVFTSDTSESQEEAKIAISFGSKSASKGWQLTLHADTPEVSLTNMSSVYTHQEYPLYSLLLWCPDISKSSGVVGR